MPSVDPGQPEIGGDVAQLEPARVGRQPAGDFAFDRGLLGGLRGFGRGAADHAGGEEERQNGTT